MEKKYKKTAAVILAAGIGSRMGCKKTKQMIEILGKSILKHTVLAFEAAKSISEIVVVCREEERDFVNKELQNITKPIRVVNGGNCRAESASNGFYFISRNAEYVMIHDAARCLITSEDIDRVADAACKYKAATASVPINDTVKRCEGEIIVETVDRRNLVAVHTPQAFERNVYKSALENAKSFDDTITDDNMLVESIGIKPYCVKTLPTNIKITTSYDLELAEFILLKRSGEK